MKLFQSCLWKKILSAGQIAFIMIWLSNLSATDSYFSVYVLIGFASFFCFLKKDRQDNSLKTKQRVIFFLCSVLFSLLVIGANYPVFTQVRDPATIQASTNLLVNFINTCFSFIGGIAVAHPIFLWLWRTVPLEKSLLRRSDRGRSFWLFSVGSFFLIAFIYLFHLFVVEYPGNVTEDPFTQIGEMVSGQYSNFNTFWHTMMMESLLSAGYAVFGDVNAAVALFCSTQALVMAFAFSYCLTTLYLGGVPKAVLFAVLAFYGFLPYHIALSITIWKDVLFSGGCLLTICAMYRILKCLSSRPVMEYLVMAFGVALFCLARNNGCLIFLISLVVFAVPLLQNKKVLAVLCGSFAVCWILCNPVLTLLNVSGGDYTESLSIPLQQVARVVTDGCELTEEETELLSQVLDLEEVPELYTNWISDPIKVAFRDNHPEYFEEHVSEYVSLWARLGQRYPGTYFKAWVDQTKGYWNGGYDYPQYSETVTDNPYGVAKLGQSNLAAKLFGIYFGLSRHVIFFEPLHSIGLHVWITAVCCLLNVMKRKREEALLAVIPLVLVVGLCFGTPVYACFRYAYPVFVSIPLILTTTIYPVSKSE